MVFTNVTLGLNFYTRQLSSEFEATRIEALHWMFTLLNRHRNEVMKR